MACLIVIGGGIYELALGNFGNLQTGFDETTASPGGVALAMFSGLFAYGGWCIPQKLAHAKISLNVRFFQGHHYQRN